MVWTDLAEKFIFILNLNNLNLWL